MRGALVVVAALVGCHPHRAAPAYRLVPGLAITCFAAPGTAGYAIVDDRREVVVDRAHRVSLVGIDPEVSLASLAFEGLALGPCSREVPGGSAPASPIIACTSPARPGRYLVRALYTTKAFAARALHQITTTPAGATIASQYAIATPIWQRRANLVVFDGVPGQAVPPREVARGDAELDGSTAILAAPAREVTARLIRIYDGAVRDRDVPPTLAATWAQESQDAVWVWLELDATLPHGAVFARVVEDGALHEIDVPPDGRRDGAHTLRLPLWIDRDLRGGRTRTAMSNTVDHVALSLSNVGEIARDVWFEEPLRPFPGRELEDVQGMTTVVGRTSVRVKRHVDAGAIDRARFTIRYIK